MEEYSVIVPPWDCCGNCAYWGGCRRVNPFFGRATVPSPGEKGVCGGYFFNQELPWNATCPGFERQPGTKG